MAIAGLLEGESPSFSQWFWNQLPLESIIHQARLPGMEGELYFHLFEPYEGMVENVKREMKPGEIGGGDDWINICHKPVVFDPVFTRVCFARVVEGLDQLIKLSERLKITLSEEVRIEKVV
ncbi:MAG: hypothetical protein FGF50_06195 [Candidatus Brockarchaeota archaeon]|nr:hypothetical protein [Candidatus Brockarchaeota archaeon]